MVNEEKNLWWRKLGFYTNPFTIKPAVFDNKVFGQEKILEELYYKVPAGTMSFIEGPLGTGKTTLMKHLISKFRGEGKVIYFSCNRIDSELNMEELLRGKYGFWGRLFGLMPKDMLVLLDESQQLSPANTERIKYFFDQGNIKSVVLTGTDYDSTEFHPSIKERIGNDGLFKVKLLSEDEGVTLIRNRIGNSKIVDDEVIKEVWKLAEKIPRRALQRMDKIFKHSVDNNEAEIRVEHLSEIFEDFKPKKESKTEIKKEPKIEVKEETEKEPEKVEEEPEKEVKEKPKTTKKKVTKKKKTTKKTGEAEELPASGKSQEEVLKAMKNKK